MYDNKKLEQISDLMVKFPKKLLITSIFSFKFMHYQMHSQNSFWVMDYVNTTFSTADFKLVLITKLKENYTYEQIEWLFIELNPLMIKSKINNFS
jgi:hypothetical protein